MTNLTHFSKRNRRWSIAAGILFFGGAFMMAIDFTTQFPTSEKGEFADFWALVMAFGVYAYYRSLELPMSEILALAHFRQGVLTLTEIATALEISPNLALRALRRLKEQGLARPRTEDRTTNTWELPDIINGNSKVPPREAPRRFPSN